MIDIIQIDKDIRRHFNNEINKISGYRKQLQYMEQNIQDSSFSVGTIQKIKENINLLTEYINDIENNISYNFYVMNSVKLLSIYRNILNKPITISFTGKTIDYNKDKKKYVTQYLDIVRTYIPYTILSNINSNELLKKEKVIIKNDIKICKLCNKKEFIMKEYNAVCLHCGGMIYTGKYLTSFKDIERVNMSAKYRYDRKIHFRDCINQYQGNQNVSIKPVVLKTLIKEFEQHKLLVGNKNTPKNKRFSQITKQHVSYFLKETGYTKHYENVTLIHHLITGKSRPKLDHIEQQLMDDFDKLTELYDKKYKNKKEFKRKNFINTQYVLYQLLRRHNIKCDKKDFNVLKTVDRKNFHDEICKNLFQALGWNFKKNF